MCRQSEYKTFIRSALKPFQAIPFVSSGAASKINNASKSIALACGSHSGSKHHSREVFKIYGSMTSTLIT